MKKMESRNSGMLKICCITEDTLISFCLVPGSGMVRRIDRASFDRVLSLADGTTTLK
jgi:hypothetical protein